MPNFHSYKTINLKKPKLAPHSRLYHLEPIVGEALTSYISRLARQHCVSTGNLFSVEIAPFFRGAYLRSAEGGPRADALTANLKQAQNLNGAGIIADSGVRALEHLTLQTNLFLLTMLPLKSCISKQKLLRRFRAWCPHCYEQWLNEKKEIYEPLLWSLKDINICSLHKQILVTLCPYCGEQQETLANFSKPGICSKCQSWLGTSKKKELPERPYKELELNNQLSITDSVNQLLAVTTASYPRPTDINFAKIISTLIDFYAEGNRHAFARFIDCPQNSVASWERGICVTTLNNLLEISKRIEIPIQSLLNDNLKLDESLRGIAIKQDNIRQKIVIRDKEALEQKLKASLKEFPPKSLRRIGLECGYLSSVDLNRWFPELSRKIKQRWIKHMKSRIEKIRGTLISASKECPPPMMKELVRRTKHSDSFIRTQFSEIFQLISQRRKLYLLEKSKQREEKLKVAISHIARNFYDNGIYPSTDKVAKALTKSSLAKKEIKMLFEIHKELGLK